MKQIAVILIFFAVVFDGFVWYEIFFAGPSAHAAIHFLDVGQGDSELVVLPGNIKVMTDAGPDYSVSRSLEKVMPATDRYIDLAIVSHPQLDHFNGFNDLIHRYTFGAFIVNGRDDTPTVREWPQLVKALHDAHIPIIILGAGDRIRVGLSSIDILSPNGAFAQSGELNDTGFVELVRTPEFRALLTADIGFSVEEWLAQSGLDIRADILKVPHHGSKTSSGSAFLSAVSPKVAVIEVGAKNRYGHPTQEAMERIASSGVQAMLRTDRDGTVSIIGVGERRLRVYQER